MHLFHIVDKKNDTSQMSIVDHREKQCYQHCHSSSIPMNAQAALRVGAMDLEERGLGGIRIYQEDPYK